MVSPSARPRRRDMHEIKSKLWLGSYSAAADIESLTERRVTHVITVGAKVDLVGARHRVILPPTEKDPHCRLIVAISDNSSARLDRHFEACSTFIREGLSQGGAVLVHCHAGQSRSPTIVAAHLMRDDRMRAQEALDMIRAKRPMIWPNTGFLDQLNAFELRLGLVSKGVENQSKLDLVASQRRTDQNLVLSSLGVCLDEVADGGDSEKDSTDQSEQSGEEGKEERKETTRAQTATTDIFGADDVRLRSERLRTKYQQLKTTSSLLALAAPLRKRSLLGHAAKSWSRSDSDPF